jgi:hypothetical protein
MLPFRRAPCLVELVSSPTSEASARRGKTRHLGPVGASQKMRRPSEKTRSASGYLAGLNVVRLSKPTRLAKDRRFIPAVLSQAVTSTKANHPDILSAT